MRFAARNCSTAAAITVLLAALLPAACREPPPPLPAPLERFAPENLPAAPPTYPSLGGVPDRPADLPTPAERAALREQLERDRETLRAGQPRIEADDGIPEPEDMSADSPPDGMEPLFEVPEPALVDDASL